MTNELLALGGIFIALLALDLLIEYRAYKKRDKSHKKGKFLQWF